MKLFSQLDDKVVVTRGYLVAVWSAMLLMAGLLLTGGPGALMWLGYVVGGVALAALLFTGRSLVKAPTPISPANKEFAE